MVYIFCLLKLRKIIVLIIMISPKIAKKIIYSIKPVLISTGLMVKVD